MEVAAAISPGGYVRQARLRAGLTQLELAERSGLTPASISRLEAGHRSPWFSEAVALARVLDLPLQGLLNGQLRPGTGPADLAVELRSLGAVDVVVPESRVPGAFRPAEETLALVVSGERPDPRLVEAVPALLAWNRWRPRLLEAFARETHPRAAPRLGWLAEVALTLDRAGGFPGGLVSADSLLDYVDRIGRPEEPDSLGYPGEKENPHRIWKYWRITCALDLAAFRERAVQLQNSRGASPGNQNP